VCRPVTIAFVNTLRLRAAIEGLPLAKKPLDGPDGGDGRYRYRNVKEAVTPLLRGLSSPSLLYFVFRFQPRLSTRLL